MAIGNMHKNLVKFGCVISEICKWTDEQTTYTLVTILCTHPGSEVTNQWPGLIHYYWAPDIRGVAAFTLPV